MCVTSYICHRTSGLTQRSLSKEAEIKGNNFHYVVKTLKSQGLIVGKQAIAKINTQAKRKAVSQDKHVISTNSLYLSRYAKNLNMNSYQRIEITKPKLECNEETNIDALQEDETLSVDYKNDVSIHDYLPAMKAICDKLEEASGKVNRSLPFVCALLFIFHCANFVQLFSLYVGSCCIRYKKGSQLQDATWAQSMEKCRFAWNHFAHMFSIYLLLSLWDAIEIPFSLGTA